MATKLACEEAVPSAGRAENDPSETERARTGISYTWFVVSAVVLVRLMRRCGQHRGSLSFLRTVSSVLPHCLSFSVSQQSDPSFPLGSVGPR